MPGMNRAKASGASRTSPSMLEPFRAGTGGHGLIGFGLRNDGGALIDPTFRQAAFARRGLRSALCPVALEDLRRAFDESVQQTPTP